MDEYDVDALLAWRAARDDEMRTSYASPILEEDLPGFTGLDYFDPDPAMAVTGSFVPATGKIDITSSTGGVSAYHLAGHATLTVGGETRDLVVLAADEDRFFIPFRDATCGAESYEGGRYVLARRSGADSLAADFNRATNPLCAYDDEFSCPMPPPDNWFTVPIRAGEKDYRRW